MKRISTYTFLVFIISGANSFGKVVTQRCWGGEGPRPFIEMGAVINRTRPVPTSGDVKEYVLWENTQDTLIYRVQNGDIFRRNLATGYQKYVGHSGTALAKVADPNRRFIYTLGLNFAWDFLTGRWSPFGPKVTVPMKEVFHRNNAMYFAAEDNYNGVQRFDFYDTSAADGKRPICSWKSPKGYHYKLGYGHEYPFVYLHRSEDVWGDHSVLHVEKFDVSMCEMVVDYDYTPLPIEGNVTDVFRYEAKDAIAVTIDHQTNNLLWDDGKSCQFYQIPSATVVPIRSDKPVFAVWAPQDGLSMLSIVDTKGGKRAQVLDTVDVARIEAKDFWLTKDGRKLFFSPQFASTYQRPLWEIQFPN